MKPAAKRTGFAIFALALCALAALWIAAPVSAAERVVIGTPSRGLFEFPAVVAIRKGFYQEEGLAVDRVQMQPLIAVKALMSGDVDYLLAWGSAVRAAITGVPIKAVAGMASRPLHVLIARPGIKVPKDLKGKTVGVDSVAATVDNFYRVALRHYGVEPDRDVKIIVTGESPTRLAALRAGSIDATRIDVAFAVKAEDEGFRRLLYLGDIIELPLSWITVMESKLQNQREQVKRIVRATIRGTRFMKQNRAETIQMLSDYLKITSSQSAKAYDASIHSFSEDGLISDKAVNNRCATHQRTAQDDQRNPFEPVGGLELGEGDQAGKLAPAEKTIYFVALKSPRCDVLKVRLRSSIFARLVSGPFEQPATKRFSAT